MRHEISTNIIINAPVAEVWTEFIHFEKYPEWNPFVKSIEGELIVGKKFKAKIDSMSFSPVLKSNIPEKSFSWKGKLLFPGIFDGHHSFECIENEDGTTLFVQEEQFFGILVPFLRKKLNTEIINGFNAMNRALKDRVEVSKNENVA